METMKKLLALFLALMMLLSLAACGKEEKEAAAQDNKDLYAAHLQEDGQIEMGLEGVEVEVNVSDVHLDCAEAFESGNWEALFTPVDMPERAIDMANFDLTPTAEEKAAMEKEPAYGQPVLFYMSDGCTSGPTVADDLGYYTEAGLTAEGFKEGVDEAIVALRNRNFDEDGVIEITPAAYNLFKNNLITLSTNNLRNLLAVKGEQGESINSYNTKSYTHQFS